MLNFYKWFRENYKTPQTAQEKRKVFDAPTKLIRSCRRHKVIADGWMDRPRIKQRSWKSYGKRRKQWAGRQCAKKCFTCFASPGQMLFEDMQYKRGKPIPDWPIRIYNEEEMSNTVVIEIITPDDVYVGTEYKNTP